jgi:hypothetical protein
MACSASFGMRLARRRSMNLRHLSVVAASSVALVSFSMGCNKNALTTAPVATPAPGLGEIQGRVCGPGGNGWLSAADVWVVKPDTTRNQTETDPDGNFALNNVDVGDQTLFIQKGSFTSQQQVTVVANQITTLAAPACVNSAHVAVVTGDWDSIQNVLSGAGITDVTLYDGVGQAAGGPTVTDLLTNFDTLKAYDIVFFNCGDYDTGDGFSHYPGLLSNPTALNNLRSFVDGGGSLYASDWAYEFVEMAFPDAIDFYGTDTTRNAAAVGKQGPMAATVTDSALAASLGHSSVNLNYNLVQWVVASTAAPGTRVLVQGHAQGLDPATFQAVDVPNAPLAVQFPFGSNGGSVIYTTFHNEQQTTADMDLILKYMVFEL